MSKGRPQTASAVLALIGEIAIEFDRWRVKAREERHLRNGGVATLDAETGGWDRVGECENPVEASIAAFAAGRDHWTPCWKGRFHLTISGDRGRPTSDWCEPCKERHRLHHEAMMDATAKRGAALRRLSHWRKVYDEMMAHPQAEENDR